MKNIVIKVKELMEEVLLLCLEILEELSSEI